MEGQAEIEYKGLKFVPYLTRDKIQDITKAVADQISKDYSDKFPIFIGILNGAFVWLSDLIREMSFQNMEVEFCKVSSYEGEKSTGFVKQLVGLKGDIKGRHVILVEDIVDSGKTMSYVLPWIESLNPASVKLASLFVKRESLQVDIKIDYPGMDIQNKFIVGYGLDFDEWGRNLPDVWIKKE